MNFLMVFIGGGIGSVLRYLCNLACSRDFCIFPYGTLLANVLGCLFLGFVIGFLQSKTNCSNLKLFLSMGIAGGFTTFSTFSLEIFHFLEKNNLFFGIFYPILSLFLGIFAIIFGLYLSRVIS